MDDNHLWQLYPHDLSLPKNYVHVWRVHLDSSTSQFKTLEHSLSSDEIVRANRFYFQKDRDRFIVARGMLRLILSRYLYIDPGHLRFCYGKYGKPYITTELNDSTLCFNMSHSHEFALYAVTWDRPIGIDVEDVSQKVDVQNISERFFSSTENKILALIPAERKQEAFFRLWTRKEAYLKARGEGLSGQLDQFDTSSFLDLDSNVVTVNDGSIDRSRWAVIDLVPHPNFVGAIVMKGFNLNIEFWEERL